MLLLSRVEPTPATHPHVRAQPGYRVEVEALATRTRPGRQQEETRAPELVPGGPESRGALDRDGTEGRGGDGASLEPAALMFAYSSTITLQDTDLNNLRVNQAQRIRTARDRATQEQRRSTPHPADAVFLASGDRGHEERRTPAAHDAEAGASRGTIARVAGAAETQKATSGTGPAETPPPRTGSERDQAGRGIFRGRGKRASEAARVAFARPNVDRGPAATTAEQEDSAVRDDRNAELLAAQLQRSLVDASVQRGARMARGAGGAQASGPAQGLSGTGQGARALPFSPGQGDLGALDTGDSRYVRWFVQQRARVQKELVFPTARALAKDQGTSVFSVIVERDGSLRGAPRLIRSSGFSDLDAAGLSAIRRAAPFAPLPAGLAPDQAELALLIPIAFLNPMVE